MNNIPIICYFHGLFVLGEPPQILDSALAIIHQQMQMYKSSGLEDAADEFHVGINGGKESEVFAQSILPAKAKVTYHGLASRAENLTLVMLENHVRTFDHEAYICYAHSKGATHAEGSAYGEGVSKPWREGMMQDVIVNWRQCVADLNAGFDIACAHWMWNMADGTQHIPAGNFLWIKASFARKLPSIFLRDRIRVSGIAGYESRYEAEVYWGNGPRPTVKSYRPNGGGGVP